MKRFVVSIIFVSMFFLGIGALIEEVGAKFKSDEKAVVLIAAARQAIGGDSNLRGVSSLTIVGNTTNFLEKDGVPATELGTMEINMELPGRFSKSVKIGNPDALSDDSEVHKSIDVVVMSKDGAQADLTSELPKDGKGVFVIRKGDGDVEWKTESGAEFKSEENRIILKKQDGTITELPADAKHKIRIHQDSTEGAAVWNTEDGKEIVVEKKEGAHFGRLHQSSGAEMLRLTMALLATLPSSADVSYSFVGEGDVDGYPANIVKVESKGTSFNLFLDASTNLPKMISYTGHNTFVLRRHKEGEVTKDDLMKMKVRSAEPLEHQIRFSDFRSVGGLLLPYRWTETAGGRQVQIFDVANYEVNPANIGEKFGNEKVFVRKMKPESN